MSLIKYFYKIFHKFFLLNKFYFFIFIFLLFINLFFYFYNVNLLLEKNDLIVRFLKPFWEIPLITIFLYYSFINLSVLFIYFISYVYKKFCLLLLDIFYPKKCKGRPYSVNLKFIIVSTIKKYIIIIYYKLRTLFICFCIYLNNVKINLIKYFNVYSYNKMLFYYKFYKLRDYLFLFSKYFILFFLFWIVFFNFYMNYKLYNSFFPVKIFIYGYELNLSFFMYFYIILYLYLLFNCYCEKNDSLKVCIWCIFFIFMIFFLFNYNIICFLNKLMFISDILDIDLILFIFYISFILRFILFIFFLDIYFSYNYFYITKLKFIFQCLMHFIYFIIKLIFFILLIYFLFRINMEIYDLNCLTFYNLNLCYKIYILLVIFEFIKEVILIFYWFVLKLCNFYWVFDYNIIWIKYYIFIFFINLILKLNQLYICILFFIIKLLIIIIIYIFF